MPFIGASAQVTLLNPVHFFVFSLEDASAPGISIETKVPTPPYGNPIQVTFTTNCVQNHVYTVLVWESVNNTPTGVVRCSYSVTVTVNSVNIRMPIYAEVDTTPNWVSGSSTVADSSYIGWTISKLTRNPDYLVFDDAPDNTKNDATRNTDGFTLSGGIQLQNAEQWCVEFAPQIVAAQSGVPSSPISSGRIVTANETFTSADKNNALIIQSATSQIVLGLPALSGVTDFTDMFYILSNGGSHYNAVINTTGSDKIQYLGSTAQVILGQGEFAGFFKAFTYWWPLCDLPGVRMVGELLYNYNQVEPNCLFCDGTIKNRADYPRLWAWVQTLATGTIAEASWALFTTIDGITVYPNKGNFTPGNDTTTFRLPLLTNIMLKGVDGSTRVSATFENHQLLDHQHKLPNVWNESGGGHLASGGTSDEGPITDLTGHPVNNSGTLFTAIGTEQKVRNIGAYLLIRY